MIKSPRSLNSYVVYSLWVKLDENYPDLLGIYSSNEGRSLAYLKYTEMIRHYCPSAISNYYLCNVEVKS